MRHRILILTIPVIAGCGAAAIQPLLPTLSFVVPVPPLPAVFVDLDGAWVLTDETGGRSCLVIQESRVSILDRTCSTDGRGFVHRITDAPIISRAGDLISLSVTYLDDATDSAASRLAFSGRLQIDGRFIGTRSDIASGEESAARTRNAVLTRQ